MVFAIKVASGFYNNPGKGLPSGSGLMLAFDATTGLPETLLLDNGCLTDLRTAAGSDGPDKQELDVEMLGWACLIVAGELGEVNIGKVPGRTDEHQITVCDLTDVGVQDAAIAQLTLQKARQKGLGAPIDA